MNTLNLSKSSYSLLSNSPDDGVLEGSIDPNAATAFGATAEEEVTRVHVYRESGPVILMPSSTPAVGCPRPSELPSNLNLFLWGGLSISVQEAIAPVLQKHVRSIALCFCGGYVFAMVPWFGLTRADSWSSPVAFLAYIIYAMLVLAGTMRVCRLLTQPTVLTLHREIEAAMNDLAPHFHKVGYDLQYGTQKTGRFQLEAFVRIVHWMPATVVSNDQEPMLKDLTDPTLSDNASLSDRRRGTGQHSSMILTPERLSSTDSTGSLACCRREFRVAVCGQYASASGNVCARKEYSFSRLRDSVVQARVDKFTWGAVANETRPLTAEYQKLRSPLMVSLVILVPTIFILLQIIIDKMHSPHGILFFVMAFFSVQGFLFLSGPMFERTIPERLLGQEKFLELHHKFDQKIRELSPLVAERSGYALEYIIEPDGYGCSSGYVSFQPQEFGTAAHHYSVAPLSLNSANGVV